MAGNRLYQNVPQQIDILKQFTENGVENDPTAGVAIKCQKIPSKNHFIFSDIINLKNNVEIFDEKHIKQHD